MPYLVVAVVLVGAVCVVDLVLSLGVVRRLRTHTELINTILARGALPEIIAPAGQRIGEFAAVTVDGQAVSNSSLRGQTLVGFFLEDCAGCTKGVPDFAAAAARFPGGRDQVLAVLVVATDEIRIAGYREQLTPVARVVIERQNGAVASAMKVGGFPAFGVLDEDGRMLTTGSDLVRSPQPAGV